MSIDYKHRKHQMGVAKHHRQLAVLHLRRAASTLVGNEPVDMEELNATIELAMDAIKMMFEAFDLANGNPHPDNSESQLLTAEYVSSDTGDLTVKYNNPDPTG